MTTCPRYNHKCVVCNKAYTFTKKNTYFCGNQCRNRESDTWTPYFSEKNLCKFCGKTFYSNKYRTFCNIKCYYAPKKKECIRCQAALQPNMKGEFCSYDCRMTTLQETKAIVKEKKLKNNGQNWAAKENKPMGVSFDYLNKKAEKERLYDKFHIDRIIRGIGTKQN